NAADLCGARHRGGGGATRATEGREGGESGVGFERTPGAGDDRGASRAGDDGDCRTPGGFQLSICAWEDDGEKTVVADKIVRPRLCIVHSFFPARSILNVSSPIHVSLS